MDEAKLSRPCPFKSGSHNGACTPLCPLWDKARRACEIRMARLALGSIADSLTRMSLQRQEMDLISERVEDLTGRVNDLPAAPELSENLDGQLDSIRVRLSAKTRQIAELSERVGALAKEIERVDRNAFCLGERVECLDALHDDTTHHSDDSGIKDLDRTLDLITERVEDLSGRVNELNTDANVEGVQRQIKDLDRTVDLISQRVDDLDERMAQKVDVPAQRPGVDRTGWQKQRP